MSMDIILLSRKGVEVKSKNYKQSEEVSQHCHEVMKGNVVMTKTRMIRPYKNNQDNETMPKSRAKIAEIQKGKTLLNKGDQ